MILLAEHDEPFLAAKKRRQQRTWSWPTFNPKNRVWGFEESLAGRPCCELDLSWETAAGSVQFTYENLSGRLDFISRDPLSDAEFSQGTNLYAYCRNSYINLEDPTGMDVYMLTNTSYGPGTGHAAMIVGDNNTGYSYQSYGSDGPALGSSSSGGGVDSGYEPTLGKSLADAQAEGYDDVNQWHTDHSQDMAALNTMDAENGTSYNVVTNNCQTAVNDSLGAAGLTYNDSFIPNVADAQDQSLSNNNYSVQSALDNMGEKGNSKDSGSSSLSFGLSSSSSGKCAGQ